MNQCGDDEREMREDEFIVSEMPSFGATEIHARRRRIKNIKCTKSAGLKAIESAVIV
jgi:hypothetical protein